MHKILTCICYVLYITIGKHLPTFRNSYKDLFAFIRYCLVRGYVEKCGNKVNVQPHATIARRVWIGDFSGIGRNSLVSGGVKIDKHVMMGPEVLIYTQNHDFSRIDITMDKQGWADEKPVVIEDDV